MGVATTPFTLIAGPANVYISPRGTSMPLVNASMPTGAWIDLGRTLGGVMVRHSQTVDLLGADQHTGPIKAVRSAEGLDIDFTLIDLTIDTYAQIMNTQSVTTNAGPPAEKNFQSHKGRNVAQNAFLVRGDSPYGAFFIQYEVPVVIMNEQPQMEFKENAAAGLHCVYTALEDLTAGTENDRFGKVRAQTS